MFCKLLHTWHKPHATGPPCSGHITLHTITTQAINNLGIVCVCVRSAVQHAGENMLVEQFRNKWAWNNCEILVQVCRRYRYLPQITPHGGLIGAADWRKHIQLLGKPTYTYTGVCNFKS
jgi:hypothetical protein